MNDANTELGISSKFLIDATELQQLLTVSLMIVLRTWVSCLV